MFGRDFIIGHGSAMTPWSDLPKFDIFNLGSFLDSAFHVESEDSAVVKVIDLFDLERNDIEVTENDGVVTVKGEYSSDIDATRIYERFHLAPGTEIKTTQFVKSAGGNKLVIIFQDKDETLVNKTETTIVE